MTDSYLGEIQRTFTEVPWEKDYSFPPFRVKSGFPVSYCPYRAHLKRTTKISAMGFFFFVGRPPQKKKRQSSTTVVILIISYDTIKL